MTYYDLTDMTPAERDALLKKEASRPVTYTTADGQRFQAERGDGKRSAPLDRVVPHPDGKMPYMNFKWDDEHVQLSVSREQGGKVLRGEDYRAALTHLSREKGWKIDWSGFGEPAAPAPQPEVEPPPVKKKRGRHKKTCTCEKCEALRAR